MPSIKIIGAGLAGCEAALQLAKAGYDISLYEMRPQTKTPAHHTGLFAELVCSNSLKSSIISTASGLLKAEMELLDCQLLKIAKDCAVPAGNALAVDRLLFAQKVTDTIHTTPNIKVINQEVTSFDDQPTILATGPLTSNKLTESLIKIIGKEYLYFFDAIAPIISAESIDREKVFEKARYDKGDADYLNCFLDKEEYQIFVEALKAGEKYQAKEFENEFFQGIDFSFYENCMPIEELAKRGLDTLRFGVMKPVGLENPTSGKRPYAVIQLRAENCDKTSYNLVGCQTMLKQSHQKAIFSLIPALKNADFLRYGSIHRNTYLNTPEIASGDLSLKNAPNIYLAGQIAGVEGYTESIFSGMLTALIISQKITPLPSETISGQLLRHLTTENAHFTPMNANFGLLPDIIMERKNKPLKKAMLSERSLKAMREWVK
ncbi:MAG: methylenetetrahydrofolate--tRNA-(uracil(54)-C(5))-methyltransferase (FADH(2)-oxidizing) TrmFO [Candidatus Cloacimonetes bacterium]|nr:methylenetetrahydrofolate--tRNA-(uracil(54)-C(5))-methyltransferase (FADH(2)-oxidizing) TrmFO [Candidatus Cloacimonadota bacterium]